MYLALPCSKQAKARSLQEYGILHQQLRTHRTIPKETIRRFVGMLEDTLVALRIPAFRLGSATSRKLTQRDRIFIFDIGVRNALLGIHRRKPSVDQLGGIFEQWMILQVFYLLRAKQKEWKLSSYRSESDLEVDLVIETPEYILGLEIKYSRSVSRMD